MNKFSFYILLFVLFTLNCVTPYDFEPNSTGRFLVVSGSINQLDSINRIRLTLSTAYETFSNATPIESAEIVLFNSKNEREPFFNEGGGWYAHYGEKISIEVGESYHIEIEYLNKKYQTDNQIVPDPVKPDKISYTAGFKSMVLNNGSEIEVESIEVFINTPINVDGKTSYLRWKADESWSFVERSCGPLHIPKVCYIKNKLNTNQILIYSSENNAGKYLPDKRVVEKINPKNIEFTTKHFFNIDQLTINKSTYEYWEKVIQIANPSGDIFDLPPAPLRGNVYNINNPEEIVLGYFEVVGKSTLRLPLYKNDIDPIRVPDKEYLCSYWGGYSSECCNCLYIENSTLERPDYWD